MQERASRSPLPGLTLDPVEPGSAAVPPPWWRPIPYWLMSISLHALLVLVCASSFVGSVGGRGGRGGLPGPAGGTTFEATFGVLGADGGEDEGRNGIAVRVDVAPPVPPPPPDIPPLNDVVPADDPGAVPAVAKFDPQRIANPIQPAGGHSDGGPHEGAIKKSAGGARVKGERGGPRTMGGAGGSDGNGVEFFGVRDSGLKIVYLIDCSSSMRDDNALALAKAELVRSIESLGLQHRFQILFYNMEVRRMSGDDRAQAYLTPSERTLRKVRQFLQGVQGDQGTNHRAAMKAALDLGPDLVFVLTDAGEPSLSPPELREISKLNRGRCRIHSIEFGRGDDSTGNPNFLKALARLNDGRHCYVDVQREELR